MGPLTLARWLLLRANKFEIPFRQLQAEKGPPTQIDLNKRFWPEILSISWVFFSNIFGISEHISCISQP